MTSLEPRRPPGLDGLAGPSSRSVLPAWKREILERKRAKLASLGAGPRGSPGGPDSGAAVEAIAGTAAGAGSEGPREPAGEAERLVLADSLGPLRENPFMRLETERKRQWRGRGPAPGARGSTARPVQQLLELYSRVPGIRTIRADNILIIESEPGFLPSQRPYEASAAGPRPAQDPLQQLLARRGRPVAEIRAAEVVIYETPRAAAEAAAQPGRVSRLLEKFDPPLASGEPRSRVPSPPRRRGSPERSRPLVPKPPAVEPQSPAASPSLPSPGPRSPSVGERAAWFQRELASAAVPSRLSDFLKKTGTNSFTVHPRGLAGGGRVVPNGPAIEATPDPHLGPANGLPARGEPVPSYSSTSKGTNKWKPNAEEEAPILHPSPNPCPMGIGNGGPSATPAAPSSTFPKHSQASATPSQRKWVSAATSTNDSFEIRPAPKPDIENIPDEDVQAKALANLRMNSKNSFVFIPKPRVEVLGARAGHPVGSKAFDQPKGKASVSSQDGLLTHGPLENGDQHSKEVVPTYRNHMRDEALKAAEEENPQKQIATILSEVNQKWQREALTSSSTERPSKQEPCGGFEISDTSLSTSVTQIHEEPSRPGLPVTYIDEVDSDDESYQEAKPAFRFSDAPAYRPHPTLPNSKSEVHYLSNNTFTVVPNRKPAAPERSFSPPNGELYTEGEEEDQWKEKTLEDPETSHENTGLSLKKRYPTVNEIEVIGGYLSLKKSCLTKIGSSRKKMKISFNEKSLQTTFEYPSESSLVQEEAEEEEEGASGSEGDEEEKPFAVFLPRATFVNSTVMDSATRPPESSSGLSSYTPKHSVEFSKWQEQKYDESPCEAGASPQKEVMLTPASKNDLSDFRSEPALYF